MDIIGLITLLAPLALHMATAVFSFVTYLKSKSLNQNSNVSTVQPQKGN